MPDIDVINNDSPAGAPNAGAKVPSTTTDQVVVTGRPLVAPVAETKMGSSRAVHEKMRKAIEEGRAKMRDAKPESVNTADAKILPSIGNARAQTSQEMREEKEEASSDAKTAPYPGNPHDAHVKAILASEQSRYAPEFDTSDLGGTTVDNDGKVDTVKVRLLFDYWDGQGVRHPLNSTVEMAINDARNLIDQRKAERTDPLR